MSDSVVDLDCESGPRPRPVVVIHSIRGVLYHRQFGGTACRWGRVRGTLLPCIGDPQPLCEIFEQHFAGAGSQGHSWTESESSDLCDAVSLLALPLMDPAGASHPAPLVADLRRLGDVDEAWVPVHTELGPGILTWENSD